MLNPHLVRIIRFFLVRTVAPTRGILKALAAVSEPIVSGLLGQSEKRKITKALLKSFAGK